MLQVWVNMRVLSLAPVQFDRNAWDHLVLDPGMLARFCRRLY